MGRYKCPQCGRGFGSVGDMLAHTQEVHTTDLPGGDRGAAATPAPARSMPTAEPGPVATERARRTGFDLEAAGGDDGDLIRPGAEEGEPEGAAPGQNPVLGTVIALAIVAALIILNLIAGSE